jgi:hypothetical protein
MRKKAWKKPQLVVLVRSKTEEAVLAHCKSGPIFNGPNMGNGGCSYTSANTPACPARCSTFVPS